MTKCVICKKPIPANSDYQNLCSEECAAEQDYQRRLEEIKKKRPRGLFKKKNKQEEIEPEALPDFPNEEEEAYQEEEIAEPKRILDTRSPLTPQKDESKVVGVHDIVEEAKRAALEWGVSPSTIILATISMDMALISGRLRVVKQEKEEEDL
jgi:hypothetical protein